MNPKSQNISRILRITKNFIRETNFNQCLCKNNDSYFYEQLFNLYSKNAPQRSQFKLYRGAFANSISSRIQSLDQKETNSIKSSRSLQMPLLQKNMSSPELNLTRNHKNITKRKQCVRKAFLLSYNSDFFPPKSNLLSPNHSVRIINDVLFSVRDDTEYQTLHYEEENIFYNKTLTSRRIKDALNKIMEYFYNYQSAFENISKFQISKTINTNTENEIHFQLTSVVIQMTNISNPDKNYEYKLPLFFAPLFYYNPCNNLPTLLLSLIHYNNKSNTIKFKISDSLYFIINSLYNSIINVHKEGEKTRKYHEFHYLWITPNEVYIIKVKMPLLTVTFKKTNTIIHKYIEGKLLLYLHDNNFNHWSFYVTHYLYSFKNFRTIVDSISSKMSTSFIKYAGKDIVISEKRIKTNDNDDLKLIYFLSSEEGVNYLLTINAMYFEVTLNNFHSKIANKNVVHSTGRKSSRFIRNSITTTHKFVFTFREFKSLLIAFQKANILDFLSKFITINKYTKGVSFNYNEFNTFPVQMLNCFPSQQNSNQESIKLFPNYVAKIVYPVFSLKGIDEKGDLSNHIITETGENIQLKEFEMNNEAINLITNANLISAPELIRKILFYLENESNIKEMLSMDDNIKKSTTKRRLTVRKTRLRKSVSLSSFSACGD